MTEAALLNNKQLSQDPFPNDLREIEKASIECPDAVESLLVLVWKILRKKLMFVRILLYQLLDSVESIRFSLEVVLMTHWLEFHKVRILCCSEIS